jgi:hypothetical protein
MPSQDTGAEKSLTLWMGCPGFKECIALKTTKFYIKASELFESSARCL